MVQWYFPFLVFPVCGDAWLRVCKIKRNYLIDDGLSDAARVEKDDIFIFAPSTDGRFRIWDPQPPECVVLQVAVLSQEVVNPARLRSGVSVGDVGGLVQLLATGDGALKFAFLNQLFSRESVYKTFFGLVVNGGSI
jgi:hypothetical protein